MSPDAIGRKGEFTGAKNMIQMYLSLNIPLPHIFQCQWHSKLNFRNADFWNGILQVSRNWTLMK